MFWFPVEVEYGFPLFNQFRERENLNIPELWMLGLQLQHTNHPQIDCVRFAQHISSLAQGMGATKEMMAQGL